MSDFGNVDFDPETLAILQGVFDEAWASFQAQRNRNITRAALAKRILNLAVKGERNPARLLDGALAQRYRTTFGQGSHSKDDPAIRACAPSVGAGRGMVYFNCRALSP